MIVLPTGFACSLEAPPRGAIASALHAITLLIAHQLVMELERYRDQAEIVTVPPLCPLSVSPYDFSHAGELIERAAAQTQRWLERGGLDARARSAGAARAYPLKQGVGRQADHTRWTMTPSIGSTGADHGARPMMRSVSSRPACHRARTPAGLKSMSLVWSSPSRLDASSGITCMVV